eukprot:g3177.t1
MFYGFVWFLSTLGYWGAAIRLAVDLILLVSAFGTGSFDAFAKHLVPSLKPFDDRLDKALWWSFALGKYGGIAALEMCTCVARLSLLVAPPVAATSWHTWVPALLIAFNVFECAVLEGRVGQHFWRRRKRSLLTKGGGGGEKQQKLSRSLSLSSLDVSTGAILNALTGVALTVYVLAKARNMPVTVSASSFVFNHETFWVPAYMFWNIKFASVAQDNAVMMHMGHAHILPFVSWMLLGTDYLDYRLPALHWHFSIGLLAVGRERGSARLGSDDDDDGGGGGGGGGGAKDDTSPAVAPAATAGKPLDLMQRLGYAAFYDHFVGWRWMACMSLGAAGFTLAALAA